MRGCCAASFAPLPLSGIHEEPTNLIPEYYTVRVLTHLYIGVLYMGQWYLIGWRRSLVLWVN